MYKSYVLKHVTEPPRLLFANTKAAIVSLCVLGISLLFIFAVADMSLMGGFLCSLVIFTVSHAYMIWMSYKDPFFVNVIIARLRCRKTKNLTDVKDNFYGA